MDKKSIGILTIQKSIYNYGGALQGYALFAYLKSLGYPVEIIDLHRPSHSDYIHSYRFPIMRQPRSLPSIIKGIIKELIGIKRWSKPNPTRANGNQDSARKFESFNELINYSQPYNFIPDLYRNPPFYDVYISGSDQLWNPTQYYCLEPYFLTFVKDKMSKKVSYGTSIGVSDIRENEKKLFSKWLATYDLISVRERQAQLILNPLVNKEVNRVPDPTFLLEPDVWMKMAENADSRFDGDYILVFSLGQESCLYNKAIDIGRHHNWKVKILEPRANVSTPCDSELVADAGPLEFINLIGHARLVLTDSFHCTVFSLISDCRNFYTYLAPHVDRGSRIIDLLELFDLSKHIVYSMDEIPSSKDLKDIEIDHEKVRNTMDVQREIGQKFLNKVLSDDK